VLQLLRRRARAGSAEDMLVLARSNTRRIQSSGGMESGCQRTQRRHGEEWQGAHVGVRFKLHGRAGALALVH
jgi:hypothetical protein